jgi:hypothetical protein
MKRLLQNEKRQTSFTQAPATTLSIFPKLKSNGKIRLLGDLVPRNKIMVKDYGHIPNQALIPRTLGRAKYRSTIDLADWYF